MRAYICNWRTANVLKKTVVKNQNNATIIIIVPSMQQWHPSLVLLAGKSQGQRSLVGCGPWGRKESDMTERFHLHFSLSCTGEGNGNPLHCSCLENPRDRAAWWAAVYGVAHSRTRLQRLSSSSSSSSNSTQKSRTIMTEIFNLFAN